MKMMTCKQMGGPCEFMIHGETADEMRKSGEAHLMAMMEKGDEAHKKTLMAMNELKNNPVEAKKFEEKFLLDFTSLPEM